MGRLNDKRRSSAGQSPLRSTSTNSDIIRPSTLDYDSMRAKKMRIDSDSDSIKDNSDTGSSSTASQRDKSWSKVLQGNSDSREGAQTRSRTLSRASVSSDGTKSDVSSNVRSPRGNYELETDPAVLSRRQKQLEYGKNTQEYHNYIVSVPKEDRQSFHPKTPPMKRKYSRRAWDGLIKQWRLNLHIWTDPTKARKDDEDTGDSPKDNIKDDSLTESTSKNEVKYTSWSEEVEEYEEEAKRFSFI